jgi:hypothetical protein
MSQAKCAVCSKTAYPLESVTALDKNYHKACFKCAVCKQALNLKNFKGFEGKIYCFTHTPKLTHTTVTDSVAMKTALAAPKKTSEGLGTVQKGIGGKPSIAVFGGGEGSAGATSSQDEEARETYQEDPPADEPGITTDQYAEEPAYEGEQYEEQDQ